MLSENLKTCRKAKGLSQEELAIKLHVVRQTVSKWEKGLSVPDADLLLALSEALVINLQLAKRKRTGKSVLHWVCIALCIVLVAGFLALLAMGSPYLSWNYQDPETAVAGVALHAAEWLYVRAAPVLLLAAAVGAILTRKRD